MPRGLRRTGCQLYLHLRKFCNGMSYQFKCQINNIATWPEWSDLALPTRKYWNDLAGDVSAYDDKFFKKNVKEELNEINSMVKRYACRFQILSIQLKFLEREKNYQYLKMIAVPVATGWEISWVSSLEAEEWLNNLFGIHNVSWMVMVFISFNFIIQVLDGYEVLRENCNRYFTAKSRCCAVKSDGQSKIQLKTVS